MSGTKRVVRKNRDKVPLDLASGASVEVSYQTPDGQKHHEVHPVRDGTNGIDWVAATIPIPDPTSVSVISPTHCACGEPAPLLAYLFSDTKMHLGRPMCNACRERDARIKHDVKQATRRTDDWAIRMAPKTKGTRGRGLYRPTIWDRIKGLLGGGRTI